MTIASVLSEKGSEVISVAPETPVLEVARLLERRRIGAALVMDGQRRVLGILSERDIVRAIATRAGRIEALPAEALMTRKVVMVAHTTPVDAALTLLDDGTCRHLPVIDADGRVLGLVSLRDLVRHCLAQHEQRSESLRAATRGRVH